MRMYLEEIILDGFKSYATRTVISGFDPKFNAITGLNGSGKSNILDAICFVLGITNLSQVGGVGDWSRRLTRSVGAREESAGVGVQAGSGGHNEGDSDSGVQQREDGGESDRVRAIRPDHGDASGGSWWSQQVPDPGPQRASEPGAEPVSQRAAEREQPALSDHAGLF